MTLARARILKANADADADARPLDVASRRLGRRVPAPIVDALREAAFIVSEAKAEAREIVEQARASATASAERAAIEAREAELARLASTMVLVRASEERRAERELERTVEIAVALAERLIGEAIALSPSRVGVLALAALEETRGAKQLRIEACPDDLAVLEELLAPLGPGVAVVHPNQELGRGSLVVHTELGDVDARLVPQLARLADALRDGLHAVSTRR